jgi:hypothetical protein
MRSTSEQSTATEGTQEAADADHSASGSEGARKARSQVPVIITACALLLAIGHLIAPQVTVDGITIGLVVCAFLPWLGSVFKSIDLPGFGKFEFLQQQIKSLDDRVVKVEQFVISGDLTPVQRRRFEQGLARFRDYLDSLGLSASGALPRVEVGRTNAGSYYDHDRNEIFTSPPFVNDTDELLREYAHHVLMSHNDPYPAGGKQAQALQSGLADYFVCSMSNDPVFGENIDPAFLKRWTGKPYLRTLENDRPFLRTISDVNDAGEAWGGAFWQMRKLLGPAVADQLLAATWIGVETWSARDHGTGFVTALVEGLQTKGDHQRTADLQRIFEARGLKVGK